MSKRFKRTGSIESIRPESNRDISVSGKLVDAFAKNYDADTHTLYYDSLRSDSAEILISAGRDQEAARVNGMSDEELYGYFGEVYNQQDASTESASVETVVEEATEPTEAKIAIEKPLEEKKSVNMQEQAPSSEDVAKIKEDDMVIYALPEGKTSKGAPWKVVGFTPDKGQVYIERMVKGRLVKLRKDTADLTLVTPGEQKLEEVVEPEPDKEQVLAQQSQPEQKPGVTVVDSKKPVTPNDLVTRRGKISLVQGPIVTPIDPQAPPSSPPPPPPAGEAEFRAKQARKAAQAANTAPENTANTASASAAAGENTTKAPELPMPDNEQTRKLQALVDQWSELQGLANTLKAHNFETSPSIAERKLMQEFRLALAQIRTSDDYTDEEKNSILAHFEPVTEKIRDSSGPLHGSKEKSGLRARASEWLNHEEQEAEKQDGRFAKVRQRLAGVALAVLSLNKASARHSVDTPVVVAADNESATGVADNTPETNTAVVAAAAPEYATRRERREAEERERLEKLEKRERRTKTLKAFGLVALTAGAAIAIGTLTSNISDDDERKAVGTSFIEDRPNGFAPDSSEKDKLAEDIEPGIEVPADSDWELDSPEVRSTGQDGSTAETGNGSAEHAPEDFVLRDGRTGPNSPEKIGHSANGYGGGTSAEIKSTSRGEGLSDLTRKMGVASGDREALINASVAELAAIGFIYQDSGLPGSVDWGIAEKGEVPQAALDILVRNAQAHNIQMNYQQG